MLFQCECHCFFLCWILAVPQLRFLFYLYPTLNKIILSYLGRWSKKISKLRVTGLCEGNSPMTSEFPAQRASNAENVFIWWRHHVKYVPHLFQSILNKTTNDALRFSIISVTLEREFAFISHKKNIMIYILSMTSPCDNRYPRSWLPCGGKIKPFVELYFA